jgi:hypothetical protein
MTDDSKTVVLSSTRRTIIKLNEGPGEQAEREELSSAICPL